MRSQNDSQIKYMTQHWPGCVNQVKYSSNGHLKKLFIKFVSDISLHDSNNSIELLTSMHFRSFVFHWRALSEVGLTQIAELTGRTKTIELESRFTEITVQPQRMHSSTTQG